MEGNAGHFCHHSDYHDLCMGYGKTGEKIKISSAFPDRKNTNSLPARIPGSAGFFFTLPFEYGILNMTLYAFAGGDRECRDLVQS